MMNRKLMSTEQRCCGNAVRNGARRLVSGAIFDLTGSYRAAFTTALPGICST